jgi:hypothetical protein
MMTATVQVTREATTEAMMIATDPATPALAALEVNLVA